VDSAVASSPSQAPWVGIYTSGTSGTPKLSLHSWSTVQKPARFAEQGLHGARWLMCYAPTTYAGLQVFFTCYGSGGLLVYPVGTMGEIWQSILQMKVDVISATPTFWRMLASTWQPGNNLRLRQATLGGEIVRQDLLDLVASRFHPMKLTHIYASTETGPALVVSDGQEGFPSAWLERTQGPVQVRIGSEGLLELRSAYRMMAYADGRPTFDDGWFRTPDLVERRGDRVHFLGRKDSIINMGGLKVPIDSVESAILGIPDILDCRVYQRASPIIGSLLCADLLLRSSDAPPGVPELKRIMRETLGHLPIPQFVQIVDSIRMAQSGKKAR